MKRALVGTYSGFDLENGVKPRIGLCVPMPRMFHNKRHAKNMSDWRIPPFCLWKLVPSLCSGADFLLSFRLRGLRQSTSHERNARMAVRAAEVVRQTKLWIAADMEFTACSVKITTTSNAYRRTMREDAGT
jgi:hypothetical protein